MEKNKVVQSKDEKVKNSMFTNFMSLGKDRGKKRKRVYFDAEFIFECVNAIAEREGRTKRFVMLSLLESGLKNNEQFRETYEMFSKEWKTQHAVD